jgi:hypothetical protein
VTLRRVRFVLLVLFIMALAFVVYVLATTPSDLMCPNGSDCGFGG